MERQYNFFVDFLKLHKLLSVRGKFKVFAILPSEMMHGVGAPMGGGGWVILLLPPKANKRVKISMRK